MTRRRGRLAEFRARLKAAAKAPAYHALRTVTGEWNVWTHEAGRNIMRAGPFDTRDEALEWIESNTTASPSRS